MVPKRNYLVRHPNVSFNHKYLSMNVNDSDVSANVHEEVNEEHHINWFSYIFYECIF